MLLRLVSSENRSGEKRVIMASSRHSGTLTSNSSRYGLVKLVRSAFDRRVRRKVRKSSTCRPLPLRDKVSQGQGRVLTLRACFELRFFKTFSRVMPKVLWGFQIFFFMYVLAICSQPLIK